MGKLSSKELRRKRKQEQKKRKREKALALEQEKTEKMKQAQKMIENDMERKAAMEPVKIGGVIEDKKEKIEQRTEKLKRSATEAGLGIVDSEGKKADLNQELLLKEQEENSKLEEPLIKPPEETPTLSKKKLKKKKKEMHRIDSAIAF